MPNHSQIKVRGLEAVIVAHERLLRWYELELSHKQSGGTDFLALCNALYEAKTHLRAVVSNHSQDRIRRLEAVLVAHNRLLTWHELEMPHKRSGGDRFTSIM